MRRLLLTTVALSALVVPSLSSATASAAPPRPQGPSTLLVAGFTDTLVTNQLSTPVAITALSNNRVAVLEKAGRVRLLQNGVLLAGSALDLTTGYNLVSGCAGSERGLLGFAVDPDFGANGYVYIYFTRTKPGAGNGDCVNRVSRFVMTGDTISRSSEVILLDNISSNAGNHNGGDLEVGNDGFLYVAVGDSGCDPRGDSGCAGSNNAAQDLSLLNGKILRIDRFSGAPAPGNPFTSSGVACRIRGNTATTPTSTCSEIYAYGLRNPWRFAFDPNTGGTRFYINDVGQGAREEVNLGILGANYGWPAREGFCANNADATNANPACPAPIPSLGYTQPIMDYPHNAAIGGDYITGGAFIPNGGWPKAFDGGYLFADGDPGKIFVKQTATPFSTFATGVGGVSDIEFVFEASGWSLFSVNPATNEVRRISYTLAAPPAVGTLAFAATTQARVFDSRNAGADTGQLRAGTSRLINVGSVQGNHRAALVNITAVQPTWAGYLTVWRPRTLPPTTSNVNSQTDQINANTSVVPIDDDGNIIVYSSERSHLIVDLLGFFDVTTGSESTSGRLVPVDPIRAVDTRVPASGSNVYTESLNGSTTVINVPLAGRYDLPAGTPVVCVMVTAIAPVGAASGFVVAHGHGTAVPTISNLNTNGSTDVRPNLVVVTVGADGSIDLRLNTVADVLVDVVGSFTDGTAPSSSSGTFELVAPSRIVDTRSSFGLPHFEAGTVGTINPSVVPTGAIAISQNIVITNTASNGFITTYPAGLALVPVVSNGNAQTADQTRSVLSFTRMGTTSVSYYTSMATDVVVDITGYFNAAGL